MQKEEKEEVILGTWNGMMHSSNPEFKRQQRIADATIYICIGFVALLAIATAILIISK